MCVLVLGGGLIQNLGATPEVIIALMMWAWYHDEQAGLSA